MSKRISGHGFRKWGWVMPKESTNYGYVVECSCGWRSHPPTSDLTYREAQRLIEIHKSGVRAERSA